MFLWSQHWLSSPLGRLTSCAQQHEFLTSGPTSTALAPPHHWPDEQLTYSTWRWSLDSCSSSTPWVAEFVLLFSPFGRPFASPRQIRAAVVAANRARPLTVVVPPRARVAKRPRAPSGWAEAARGRGAACCRIVVTVPILASMAVGRPESAPSPVAMMNRDDKSVEVRSPL